MSDRPWRTCGQADVLRATLAVLALARSRADDARLDIETVEQHVPKSTPCSLLP